MPSTKKRRLVDMQSSDQVILASLQPANGTASEDSIEDCLAEMAGATATSHSFHAISLSSSFPSDGPGAVLQSNSKNELLEQSVATMRTSAASSRHQRERVATWDRAMHLWQSAGAYTPGLLPSFDVEVARHFKVQSLSSYLLEACKGLKMPAFERW
jgi:hypothetical protein